MSYPRLGRSFPLAFLCVVLAAPIFSYAQDQKETHIAKVDQDGVQRVRIFGGSYFFKPNRVVVKANVPVELAVSVESGVVPHTFVLNAPEAGIAVDEELSTDPKTVRLTATAPGKYPFYCKNQLLFFASHRERGQEGVLEVVP
jgi:plastocyanin domain-containing protein